MTTTRLLFLSLAALATACATAPPPPPPVTETPPPAPVATTPPPPAIAADESEGSSDGDAVPEAPPGKPPQTDTGRFRVSIAASEKVESAQAWARKAEAAGYRTEILPVEIDGKAWQRVLLPGYASLADAQAALPFIDQDLGVKSWVTSRRRAPLPTTAAAPAPAEAISAPSAPVEPAPTPVPEAAPAAPAPEAAPAAETPPAS